MQSRTGGGGATVPGVGERPAKLGNVEPDWACHAARRWRASSPTRGNTVSAASARAPASGHAFVGSAPAPAARPPRRAGGGASPPRPRFRAGSSFSGDAPASSRGSAPLLVLLLRRAAAFLVLGRAAARLGLGLVVVGLLRAPPVARPRLVVLLGVAAPVARRQSFFSSRASAFLAPALASLVLVFVVALGRSRDSSAPRPRASLSSSPCARAAPAPRPSCRRAWSPCRRGCARDSSAPGAVVVGLAPARRAGASAFLSSRLESLSSRLDRSRDSSQPPRRWLVVGARAGAGASAFLSSRLESLSSRLDRSRDSSAPRPRGLSCAPARRRRCLSPCRRALSPCRRRGPRGLVVAAARRLSSSAFLERSRDCGARPRACRHYPCARAPAWSSAFLDRSRDSSAPRPRGAGAWRRRRGPEACRRPARRATRGLSSSRSFRRARPLVREAALLGLVGRLAAAALVSAPRRRLRAVARRPLPPAPRRLVAVVLPPLRIFLLRRRFLAHPLLRLLRFRGRRRRFGQSRPLRSGETCLSTATSILASCMSANQGIFPS